ncbi:MAG: hypothetical protein LAN84_06595 [Acidobacteriia bacterium]|nr:hypothetical protein [Terriglobia bacterium]
MPELSRQQMQILERLFAAGFRPIAIPPYENALCVRRGECAAVLAPVENGGLRLQAPPSYLVAGNLSVRIQREGREFFVWKKSEMEATVARRAELERFRAELNELLEQGLPQ